MLKMLMATLGMAAVGVLVWKLLQCQEESRSKRDAAHRDDSHR